ncbi:MAG: hypothetical protein A2711_05355 [Burkholderiales bacterium RIFCSPHIGHO2_01_FULL_63_240]|nr:MAG: hypothetical protein A2711_05355 [Burkholderiales bacterium RIFCSPHIGHO2_01_FULL_63_240]
MWCWFCLSKRSSTLYGAQDMGYLAALMRVQVFWILLAHGDDGCAPLARIVSSICPCLYAAPELLIAGKSYGGDASVTPFGFDLVCISQVKRIEP